ncbi:MAG: extracellular solute-binding protein [Phycisphaerales bacterium]|nr:extracellular solute-binding protein [Phycisphaerales bacterium]
MNLDLTSKPAAPAGARAAGANPSLTETGRPLAQWVRTLSLRFGLLGLILLLAGCGDDDAPQRAVRVSNWLNAAVNPAFLSLERTFEREYEANHPGVRLISEPIPGPGRYAPKLLLAHLAGSVPDAGYLDAASEAVFINNGVVADLMPFVRADPDFSLDDYFPEIVSTFRRGDKLYGVPLDFTPMVIYYNRRIFQAAGIDEPRDGWTFDEFLATCAKLKAAQRDGKPVVEFPLYFENVMPFWICWIWNGGGDVLIEDGTRASGALDSPQTIDAFHNLIALMFKHRYAPTLIESAAAGVDMFRTARAAMDMKGHWMLLDYRADGLDVGVVSIPTTLPRPVTVVYQSGLMVMSRAAEPQLGWEYVKHLTSESVQTRRVASGLAISANKKTAAKYADSPLEQAFLRQMAYSRSQWGTRVERYPYVEEVCQQTLKDLVSEIDATLRRSGGVYSETAVRARVAAALTDAARRIDEFLR